MKIQELGCVITDVPEIDHIRIVPNEHSDRGVRVEVKFGFADHPASYGVDEFAKLLDAFAEANARLRALADSQDPR